MKKLNDAMLQLGFRETFENTDFSSINRCFVKKQTSHKIFSLNYCHSRYYFDVTIILQKKEALDFDMMKFIKDLASLNIFCHFKTEHKGDKDIRFLTFDVNFIA